MRVAILFTFLATCFASLAGAADKPIKALLITGGGYHDYKAQSKILTEGINKTVNVDWTVVLEDIKPVTAVPKVYQNEDWADGFDVVIHNECYAGFTDTDVIDRIVKSHTENGVGAVMIHCAMHTFRNSETKEWDKLVGVASRRHGAKYPIVVRNLAPEDPIMKSMPRTWTTPKGELYMTSLMPGAKALGVGFKEGEEEKTKQTCIWRSEYGKARTFGTTMGHHNETMQEEGYIKLITHGMLWTVRKLGDDGRIDPAVKAKPAEPQPVGAIPTKFRIYSDNGVRSFASEQAFVAAEVPTATKCCGQVE